MEEEDFPPIPAPYILCAAIHFPNGKKYSDQPLNIESGYVVAGRRHSNCYKTLEIIGVNIGDCDRKDEGFITSDNRFLNRAEAALLAKERGQLLVNYTPEILISENLYYP